MAAAAHLRRLWTGVTVEPMVACYMTAYTLVTLTVSNLNLQKACAVELRLDRDTCDGLAAKTGAAGTAAEAEAAVQRTVAEMMLWQTCVQNALPCALVLLVGAWSDRARRRVPCMLLPLYGELARNAGQLLCVYYFRQLSIVAAGVAETVPLALTGGQTMMTMTVYSYVGDVTSAENRTFRIGVINAVMAISMVIGTSLSGIVYNKLGFYGAYGISSVLLIMGLSYGLIFVKDVGLSVEVDGQIKSKSYKSIIFEIFDLRLITQSFKTTFKKRSNTQRLKIIILLIILMTSSGTNSGTRTVSYLYTRVKFNWNEVKFSIYSTFELLVNITGLLFATFILNKQLKISDEMIGVLSTISQTLAALFYFFASTESIFYMGSLVNVLITAENLSIKSLMTKLVPNTELGKIAAIFGIAEIIASLVFGLMYNIVYETTINIQPGTFYIITFIFSILSIALFLWMYMARKKECKHSNDASNEKSPQVKYKSIDHSNYGTIVKS